MMLCVYSSSSCCRWGGVGWGGGGECLDVACRTESTPPRPPCMLLTQILAHLPSTCPCAGWRGRGQACCRRGLVDLFGVVCGFVGWKGVKAGISQGRKGQRNSKFHCCLRSAACVAWVRCARRGCGCNGQVCAACRTSVAKCDVPALEATSVMWKRKRKVMLRGGVIGGAE